jgi:hypothetical protein
LNAPRAKRIVITALFLAVAAACGGDDGSTTVSTTSTTRVRPPQAVRVLVLNGSGVDQAAATMATVLRGVGYALVGTGNAPLQDGTVVACRAGYDGETVALARVLGDATIVAYPDPVPVGAEPADCIVGLGRA